MRIVNLTGEDWVVIKDGTQFNIPRTNQKAQLSFKKTSVENTAGVKTCKIENPDIIGLPPPTPNQIFAVSYEVFSQAPNRKDVVCALDYSRTERGGYMVRSLACH